MSGHLLRRPQRGFTLVEAIAVIVIMGILGSFIMTFIQVPVLAYVSTAERAAASDMADNAMRRLARDLRLALPNSVRVNPANTYIEYIETKTGLRYLAEDDVGAAPGAPYLNWNDVDALQLTVVGGVPGGRHAPVVGDSVVVYNLGPDQKPGDAYDCSNTPVQCNRAAITALAATSITMGSNPFALQASAGTPLMSPGKRMHVVTSPVTYGCTNRQLIRYWNYGFNPAQQAPPAGALTAVLADNVESCVFNYTSLANQRSGMIGITLTFTPQAGGAPMTLLHQIHVDNTP
jgi:MSHA biogenesis protein MshO